MLTEQPLYARFIKEFIWIVCAFLKLDPPHLHAMLRSKLLPEHFSGPNDTKYLYKKKIHGYSPPANYCMILYSILQGISSYCIRHYRVLHDIVLDITSVTWYCIQYYRVLHDIVLDITGFCMILYSIFQVIALYCIR